MEAYGIDGAVQVNSRGHKNEEDGRESRYTKKRVHGRPASYDSPRANALLDYMRKHKFEFLRKVDVRHALGMSEAQYKGAIETAGLMDAALGEDDGEIFYWPWKEWEE